MPPSYKGGPPNATASRLRAARHPVFAILRRDVLVDDLPDQFDDLTPRPKLCGGMRGQIELAERERGLFRGLVQRFGRNRAIEEAGGDGLGGSEHLRRHDLPAEIW